MQYLLMIHQGTSPTPLDPEAVAIAEAEGPAAGLAIIDGLDLENHEYTHAARGELQLRLGSTTLARESFARALELTRNPSQRRFIERRLQDLDDR
jgi:RNA polymerase sigma-70 factor, ECF subfamily